MRLLITREGFVWALAALLASFVVLTLTGVARGGDLDPSTAPVSSMKTLDQLEPATAITSIPATIDQPGSYYLAIAFEGTAPVAIEITASDVALDFRGLPLIGDGTGTAVLAGAETHGVELTNGTIAGWGSAISLAGTENTVSEMLLIGGGDGIILGTGTVTDNRVIDGSGPAVVLSGGIARGNIVHTSTGDGAAGIFVNGDGGTLIEDNWVAATGGYGITATTVGTRSRFQDNHVSSTLMAGYEGFLTPIVFIRNTGANDLAPVFDVIAGAENIIGCFVGSANIATAPNELCNIGD